MAYECHANEEVVIIVRAYCPHRALHARQTSMYLRDKRKSQLH
jgi:hypothetical protein